MTLAHQLRLLELDDATGESLAAPDVRPYLLAGAAIGELVLRGRLVPTRGDRFGLTGAAPSAPALREAESWFPAGDRSLTSYVAIVGERSELPKIVTDELVAAGALRAEHDRVWFVPWRTRWPSADHATEQTLVEHLRSWLAAVGPSDPTGPNDLLLSLLRAGKLLHTVWTAAELARLDDTVRARTELSPMGRQVAQAASDAAAAIAVTAAVNAVL